MHGGRGQRMQPRREPELRDRVFVWDVQLLKPEQERGVHDYIEHSSLEEHLLRAGAVLGEVVVRDVDLLGHVMRGLVIGFPRHGAACVAGISATKSGHVRKRRKAILLSQTRWCASQY